MNNPKLVLLFLKISIASVFLYAAIASFLQPYNWIGYFPEFMKHVVPQQMLLNIFSVYEILLALWILSGKYTFYAALVSALTLIGIVLGNITLLDIVFRDLAIIFAAIALALATYSSKEK